MNLAEVAELRLSLWQAGYRPLPLLSFDHPDPLKAGKAPLSDRWQIGARENPPQCIRLGRAVSHAANTGIMADGLRIIDIDIDDAGLAVAARALAIEMLGDTIVRYRDNAPRCALVYRAAEGSPRKVTVTGRSHSKEQACKVEILGHGQQLAAHGIHYSGQPLRWRPCGPEGIARDDLPAVTEDQIATFLEAAGKLIDAPASKAERQKKPNGQAGAHHTAGTVDLDVIAALAAIPNDAAPDWESWNNVGMATWLATNGAAHGFMAWAAWSAKNTSHDHELCLERWEHYSTSPPDRTGPGKLYAMAAEARPGWRRPGEQRGRSRSAEGQPPGVPIIEWRDDHIAAAAGRDLPDRQWIVPEWIPTEQTTGLYGIGGINKTDFLLQLMMAASRGLPFLGHQLEAAPAYGLFCEDTYAEIIRRAARIAQHYGYGLADFPDVHFVSLVGFRETEFVTFDGPKMLIGPALGRFCQGIIERQARLCVLDTVPDFFGGNEISRREVAQFVRVLDAVSMHHGCAIVFSAHPSVRGQESGALDSGSTGWGAKVRSRLSLHDPGEDDEDEDDAQERRKMRLPPKATDRRILIRQKSNYAAQGVALRLVCRGGVFIPEALDRETARGPLRNAAAEAMFLELLPRADEANGYVHLSARAPERYAPAVFAARTDNGGFSKAEFARAMKRLLEAGRLKMVPFGPPSHARYRLTIVPPKDTTLG